MISVFKYFSIHKILVHPNKFRKKSEKNPKNLKKSKKSKDFFEDLKSVNIIWECIISRFQCLNTLLLIKSSYTQKNPEKIRKNPKKSEKSEKNPRFFLGFKIRILYLGVNNPSTISVTFGQQMRMDKRSSCAEGGAPDAGLGLARPRFVGSRRTDKSGEITAQCAGIEGTQSTLNGNWAPVKIKIKYKIKQFWWQFILGEMTVSKLS